MLYQVSPQMSVYRTGHPISAGSPHPSLFPHQASFFFLATPSRNRILVPRTRDQPPAVETWSLNHWTTREVPRLIFLMCLITQSTLCNPMDCIPPGFSVHGDSPGNHTGMGCHALFQGIFPTQGLSPGLPHWMWILYHLNHQHLPLSEFIYISCPTG